MKGESWTETIIAGSLMFIFLTAVYFLAAAW